MTLTATEGVDAPDVASAIPSPPAKREGRGQGEGRRKTCRRRSRFSQDPWTYARRRRLRGW